MGSHSEHIVSFSLEYLAKKQSVKNQKAYLDTLLPEIDKLNIKYLLVCDGDYFKTLAGVTKAEPYYGYAMDCKIKGYEHLKVFLCANHQVLFFNPVMKDKINLALNALNTSHMGTYSAIGGSIIHSESYPESVNAIKNALANLHKYDTLTCDIETFSLKHYEAGIGTIAFAWDKNNGIAFRVDVELLKEPIVINKNTKIYTKEVDNIEVKKLLKEFFSTYKGKLTYHNSSFDVSILIYELWMRDI